MKEKMRIWRNDRGRFSAVVLCILLAIPFPGNGVSADDVTKQGAVPLLYATSLNEGVLFTIDPDTGARTTVGPFDQDYPPQVIDVQWSSDGSTLYGATFGVAQTPLSQILEIDPATGNVISATSLSELGVLLSLEADAEGRILAIFAGSLYGEYEGEPEPYEGEGEPEPKKGETKTATDRPAGATRSLVSAQGPSPFGTLELVEIDPNTGDVTSIGPIGEELLTGLAFDPAFLTLYAVESSQSGQSYLVSLNTETGTSTRVATIDLPDTVFAIEFTADGRMVTVSNYEGNLYEVDPETGATSLIGATNTFSVTGMSL